ncbi:MAG TPA: hypothetical protein VMY77_00375 [Chitinophagaceae bacterium]|nr:hypothetical protein [Chitinophagaceae bacterium]
MKKLIHTLIAILLFNITVSSQARYVFIDFKDGQRPAIVNEFSYPENTVSKAIRDKMEKAGFKGKDSKGYTMYKNVSLPELGSGTYDVYFKVDRKSKKEKDMSHVTMLVSRGNEVYISEADDAQTISNAKAYLDNLIPNVQAFDLEQQITAQQDAVNKAEKKYKNLLDDADDLQKKKRKIEQQIEDNYKDQKNQQSEIDKQKQIYENLKAKRR